MGLLTEMDLWPIQRIQQVKYSSTGKKILQRDIRCTESLNINIEHYFAQHRHLDIFPSGFSRPNYKRLHVKLVMYQDQEHFKYHIDQYDVIALVVSGSRLIRTIGNMSVTVPLHR